MENNKEQFINPDSWTEKELLKHLYREVKNLTITSHTQENKIGEISKEIERLEKLVSEEKTIRVTREEEVNKRISKNNTIIGVIGLIVAIISLWLTFNGGSV